jgi:hypothetical protein
VGELRVAKYYDVDKDFLLEFELPRLAYSAFTSHARASARVLRAGNWRREKLLKSSEKVG